MKGLNASSNGEGCFRRKRSLPRLFWLAAALAVASVGQLYFARQLPLLDGLLFYGVALLLFLRGSRDREESRDKERPAAEGAPVSRPSWLVGAVGLLALGASGMALWRFAQSPTDASAWLLFFLSVAAFLVASFLWQRSPLFRQERASSSASEQRLVRIAPWLLLAGITLLAFFLRVYRVEELPFGLWYDEANSGLEALRILKDPGYHPLYVSSSNSPSADVHLTAAALQFFGEGVLALRIGSVLVGTLTVPALFLLARELMGFRLALVASFLVAVSRWDITFSRLGMQGATAPLLTALAAFFLLHALRTHRLLSFAAAGLTLGTGLWFYPALRLFPLVVAFHVGVCLVTQRGLLRRSWQGLLLLVLGAGLAAAPVLLYATLHPDIFFDRTINTSVFTGKTLGEAIPAVLSNAQKHLLMFNRQGDPNGRHNLPGEPALDHATGLLGVLGLGYALSRWREPRHQLLVVWFLVMLSAGILSLEFEAPQSLRSIGVLPVAYLLSALALQQLALAFREATGRGSGGWFWAPLVILLGFIGYSNGDTYFRRQAQDYAAWNAGSTAETFIGYRLRTLPREDQEVYLSSIYRQHPTVRFLAPSWSQQYRTFDVSQTLPLREGKDTSLFLEPQHLTSYHQVREYYPEARCQAITLRSDYTPPMLYSCVLDRTSVTSVQGLAGHYFSLAQEGDPTQVLRSEPTPVFQWQSPVPLSPPFGAEWNGVLYAPSFGRYRFALEGNAPAALYLDDGPVLDPTRQEGDATLARGLHAIRITAKVVEPKGMLRLLWRPPEGAWEVIPASSLYHGSVQARGLLGRYYPNPNWAGPPAFEQVDPSMAFYFHLTPLPRPYSVEWEGKLYAPQGGGYRFGTENISSSTLTIDGELVVENPWHNRYVEGAVALSAGWHDVRVRFQDKDGYSHLYLYWTPPGEMRELVPAAYLRPY